MLSMSVDVQSVMLASLKDRAHTSLDARFRV